MFDNVALGCVVFRYVVARTVWSGRLSRSSLRHKSTPRFLKSAFNTAQVTKACRLSARTIEMRSDSARDEISDGTVAVLLEALGPRSVELRPLGRGKYSAFGDFETCACVVKSKHF